MYVGGAADDASFTEAQAETLDQALTAAGVEHTIESGIRRYTVSRCRTTRPYDEAAAEKHWDAMKEFFGAHLGG